MLLGHERDILADLNNFIYRVQFEPASPDYQRLAIKLATCGRPQIETFAERSLRRDGKLKEARRAATQEKQRWRPSGVIRQADPDLGLPRMTDRFAGATSLGVVLDDRTRPYEYLLKLIKSKLKKCDVLVTTHGQLARELPSRRSVSGHVSSKTIQRGLARLAAHDYLLVEIEKDRRTGFDIGVRITLLPRCYPPGERESRAKRTNPWVTKDLPDFRYRQQRRLDLRDRCNENDLGRHQCPTPYPAIKNTPCSAGEEKEVDACEKCEYVDKSALEVCECPELDAAVELLEQQWEAEAGRRRPQ